MRKKEKKQKRNLLFSTAVVALGCLISAVYANHSISDSEEYQVDLSQLDFQEDDGQLDDSAMTSEPQKENLASAAGNSMVDRFEITSQTAQQEMEKAQQKLEPITDTQQTLEEEPDLRDAVQVKEAPKIEVSFQPDDKLLWPVEGNVIIGYSMDKSVYFETLDQYRYNPALYIGATAGDKVSACANGKVIEVGKDPRLGDYVCLDLGNGYQAKYAQLTNLQVEQNKVVSKGQVIADVASPTRYYSVEGDHLYLEITKDGAPVDPMTLLE